MAKKKVFTSREFMEMAVSEMKESISEHDDKPDPKVGALLVSPDGKRLIDKAHRGEIRAGDHAEFALLDKKHRNEPLTGHILYSTLEPCVERNPPKSACVERTINARIKKVYVGIQDPHPTVRGDGIRILEERGIEVDFFDSDLAEEIRKENKEFIDYAEREAKKILEGEVEESIAPLEKALEGFTPEDFSVEAQQELIDRAELGFKVNTEGFLRYLLQLHLIKINDKINGGKPTGLGLLLLGKNPQPTYPQARVQFIIDQPDTDDIIKPFEGPVLLQPRRIEEYLQNVYPRFISRKKLQRDEYYDVPIEAIREIINNAIAHRDYLLEGSSIKVYIYSDKVEVHSPGKPIHPIEKFRDFNVPPISRNPKIAYLFNQIGVIEEVGFGMKELRKLASVGNLPRPSFRMNELYFITTVYTKYGAQPTGVDIENRLASLNKAERKGFDTIMQRGRITTPEYQELMGVSERTARYHLRHMTDSGLLASAGAGKATVYTLKE
jgi:ATP-dependent DNA helicase RecG